MTLRGRPVDQEVGRPPAGRHPAHARLVRAGRDAALTPCISAGPRHPLDRLSGHRENSLNTRPVASHSRLSRHKKSPGKGRG